MAISPGPALQEFLIRRTQHQAANPATANYWNIFPLTQIFSPPTAALQGRVHQDKHIGDSL